MSQSQVIKTFYSSKLLLTLVIIKNIIAIIIIFGIFWLIRDLIEHFSTKLILTKNSVVHQTGFLKTTKEEVVYENINVVSVSQGILGKILNFGDLEINTGGDRPEILFKNIANPEEVKREILRCSK